MAGGQTSLLLQSAFAGADEERSDPVPAFFFDLKLASAYPIGMQTASSRRAKNPAAPMASILHATPGNPLPDNFTAGFFEGQRGVKIRYAIFKSAQSRPRGTVVLLQGRNECIEKYYETIRDLNAMGLWVATYDLRGQGGSGRMLKNALLGHVRRFIDYERDLESFLEQIVLPDTRLPFFLLAHSTGALIALSAAPRLANRIERMVLCAPFVGLQGQSLPPGMISAISTAASYTGLGGMRLGKDRSRGPFEGNRLTSDTVRYARNAQILQDQPQLIIGPPTARWFHESRRTILRIMQSAHLTQITVPTLIIAPVRDGIVPYADQENLARHFRASQLVPIAGARHEVLQERDLYRAQALAAIQAFFTGSDLPEEIGARTG